MRFIIQRNALLKPLQMVIGAIERRQTMPILANVLLVVADKKLSMTCTDLEIELISNARAPITRSTYRGACARLAFVT